MDKIVLDKAYVGDTAVDKIYLGNTKIFPSGFMTGQNVFYYVQDRKLYKATGNFNTINELLAGTAISKVCCSQNGNIVFAVEGENGYLSFNCGQTFKTIALPKYYGSIAISGDGSLIITSDAYGSIAYAECDEFTTPSWTVPTSFFYPVNIRCVAMSFDGTYQVFVVGQKNTCDIYVTKDHGETFTNPFSIDSKTPAGTCVISNDGRYMLVASKVNVGEGGDSSVAMSKDYGTTWKKVKTVSSDSQIRQCAMSTDGSKCCIAYEKRVSICKDYGVTWIDYPIESVMSLYDSMVITKDNNYIVLVHQARYGKFDVWATDNWGDSWNTQATIPGNKAIGSLVTGI